ncbi:MAG: FAD-dependent oxidoreductase [Pseudobutyrivibrio sp.]|uniref:NAD(P)/FAD-dependent oxidoreductase n=1 Tax=Pseudobutyrivibrio sp. TaxID=2014367 RepID=UPI0025DE99D2|nr:FAD-dependent oxidoreductase [Pseudobutyrivibrio sp.]MBE5903997.1 FAD-dependent oxidoreductase [Pseudobutyrivibrio sp.]
MLKVDQLKLDISHSSDDLLSLISKKLRVKSSDITSWAILKKSVDARKKPDVYFVYSVSVELAGNLEKKVLDKNKKDNNINPYSKKEYALPRFDKELRPIVIGAGPAGLFAAYAFALNNMQPIIFERGKKVDQRTTDILKFWETGVLDTKSNVQFGEGGAGTFSDGKLNTLVNDKLGRNKFVLETFVKFGAPSNILYDYKPHIGTDVLKDVIKNLRNEIIRLGGEFHFNCQVTDFLIEDGKIKGVLAGDKKYLSENVVLAIGHSARDTFKKLYDLGFDMEAKDFAVGFRIEHPQAIISQSMYGPRFDELEPAAYKLACNLDNGRGVYSFCMCPGGYVVNSSSEANRLVVNGMSYSKRDSKNANSAIVVTVGGREFDKTNPLSGIEYQRAIENKAFELCDGKIPQQLFGDYKTGKISSNYGDFDSVTKGLTAFGPLHEIFSQEIRDSIIDAMGFFGTKIKGFDRLDSILSGVESRTSSPVRIKRNELFQSNVSGLYPCGEGAGYAGGITSAAMDGLKVAEAVIANNKE